jgi:hypothetical protein
VRSAGPSTLAATPTSLSAVGYRCAPFADIARLAVALLDQLGTTVKAGRLEILDIDDTFCAAHGGQQLAFWNAHHDERGFASMHIYHAASGTPVATILRPARTPKGTEVRKSSST